MRLQFITGFAVMFMLMAPACLYAEDHILTLQLEDGDRRPLSGIEIGVLGIGGSAVSDAYGKVRIRLGNDTREGATVSLQVVHHKRDRDYEILSPIDSRLTVPSFRDEAGNFGTVMVVKRGDKLLLGNNLVVSVFATEISRSLIATSVGTPPTQITFKSIAQRFGLSESEVEKAILNLALRGGDPYDSAVADMAQGNFAQAIPKLDKSLAQRESELEVENHSAFEAAYQLGLATLACGQFQRSLNAMRIANRLQPRSIVALEGTGLALGNLGRYSEAIISFRDALNGAIEHQGAEGVSVPTYKNNLANALIYTGQFTEAKELLDSAENINRLLYGQMSVQNVTILLTRALFMLAEANQLDEQKIEAVVDLTATGVSAPKIVAHVDIAILQTKREKQRLAEEAAIEAAEILQKHSEGVHRPVREAQFVLGDVLQAEGDYARAAMCYSAYLGPDWNPDRVGTPETAPALIWLAYTQLYLGKSAAAKTTLRMARDFIAKSGIQDSLLSAELLESESLTLATEGKMNEAVGLLNEALSVQERSLNADDPVILQAKKVISYYQSGAFNPRDAMAWPPLRVTEHRVDISALCPTQ